MNFERKKARAIAILESKKMWRSNYAPPYVRLLWRLGFKVPPLPFASFWLTTLIMGIPFGAGWGIAMWFAVWRSMGWSAFDALNRSLIAGISFGMVLAGFHFFSRMLRNLPAWKDL